MSILYKSLSVHDFPFLFIKGQENKTSINEEGIDHQFLSLLDFLITKKLKHICLSFVHPYYWLVSLSNSLTI